uniref:Uncharacterized protein n=1 Tax=Rhizophora mucronata TaxID=61149 RepID=A0A2P2N2D5_RHIMU
MNAGTENIAGQFIGLCLTSIPSIITSTLICSHFYFGTYHTTLSRMVNNI